MPHVHCETPYDNIIPTPVDNTQHDYVASNHLYDTSFVEVMVQAVARSIEEIRQKEQSTPHASVSGEIVSAKWEHIEKRPNREKNDTADMKRTIVDTGAPYDETHTPSGRRRDDTTNAKELVNKLGTDPVTIQSVFRFRKRPTTDRSPLMKVTFVTEATRDDY